MFLYYINKLKKLFRDIYWLRPFKAIIKKGYNQLIFTPNRRKYLKFLSKIKSENIKQFLLNLYTRYQSEINKVSSKLENLRIDLISTPKSSLSNIESFKDKIVNRATSLADCLYLYLLIRHYKPKVVFEIGTWIGTSAAVMAEAIRKNGSGKLYTCDINNIQIISDDYKDIITYYNMHSDDTLDKLYKENIIIDFVFNDAHISKITVDKLKKVISKDIIFTTHDYKLPYDKGVKCVYLMNKFFVKKSDKFKWFLPEKDLGYKVGSFKINERIALLIPKKFVIN